MQIESTITFENADKTQKAVITITNTGKAYEVDCEFTPRSAEYSKELFSQMAVKFIKHLHSGRI